MAVALALCSALFQHGNLAAQLMEAVKSCSPGQVSGALCESGGIYGRNMQLTGWP